MTVYNIDLGIGWASSGIEYAEKYRDELFRRVGIKSKFVFSDLILADNIEALTKNLGFADDQIIWLYNFFTDVRIAPSTFTLKQLGREQDFAHRKISSKRRAGNEMIYNLNTENLTIVARLVDPEKGTVDQVTYLRDNTILMRDFYSYVKYAREYYLGQKGNYVTAREFYKEDGSIAYVEHLNDHKETFEFPHQQFYYSKNDLYREMIKRLHLTAQDVVIIDRQDENHDLSNGQLFFEEAGPAKIIVVVHAEHYDPENTNDQHVLWNNFYEYQFTHYRYIDSFVVSTPAPKKVLLEQFKKYYHAHPRVDCIPVGSLATLKTPAQDVKPHSLITASRLAPEKHVDWLVNAVIAAKKKVPDLSFDIYGRGQAASKIRQIIEQHHAQSYIRLMGQYDLTNVYRHYGAYVAASTSEGFGLSLMEAVGSGLPMIGFDVPYGNPTFIDNGKNGYLLPYDQNWDTQRKWESISQAIVKLFTEDDLAAFRQRSYGIAAPYLSKNVAKIWQKDLESWTHD